MERNSGLPMSVTICRGGTWSRNDRVRSSLVIAEVAVCVVLVVIGGQLLGSFVRLIDTDPGFQADRILAAVVLPAPTRYPDLAQRGLFYKRILDSVRALPGVESAGTVDALPFSGENHGGSVGRTEASSLDVEVDVVGGDYLQAMGIRLFEGRWFREEEMAESNDSAIVSDLVATRLWPKSTALGQWICVDCTPESPGHWKRIIGIVSSGKHSSLDEASTGNVYLSAGAMQRSDFLVVRTPYPTGELEKAIRRTIAAIDPNQPVLLSTSMAALIGASVADQRFVMILLAATAGIALLMSVAGVYGVVSYTTSCRTQEIGIRMAVGATPRNVFSLIFRQGFATVAIGLAIGMCAAFPLTHVLSSLLTGLQSEPSPYVWIALTLVTVTAALACGIPARRATGTDPISALQQE